MTGAADPLPGVGNICYGSTADLSVGPLAVDAVTTDPGWPATPVDEFRASDYAFTPCEDDGPAEQHWRRFGLVGLGVVAVGFVLLVVGGVLRQRAAPRPRTFPGPPPGPLA